MTTTIVMTGDTFDIWIPEYLSSIKTKNYSKNTIIAYQRIIELFARYKTYLTYHGGKAPESIGELMTAGMSSEVDARPDELEKFFELSSPNGISSRQACSNTNRHLPHSTDIFCFRMLLAVTLWKKLNARNSKIAS